MISRRSVLGAMATVAAPVKISTAAAAPALSIEERINAAKRELVACLEEKHGRSVDVVQHEEFIALFVPPKPPEYDGPAFYEVEDAKGRRPIYWLERIGAEGAPGGLYRAEMRWKGKVERTVRLKHGAFTIIRKVENYGA
ncbi:hypothetical protein CO661_12075 [Sinorhizobium fredii]|uniref:Uncharacterized protein n=1 Tax=Rhizobium fredii TaxID=380 RepID=A0A2A6LY47_RHIFR|nr:hypothetical protein [Sinorhizobium fredii]PDT47471.1 hypothetical protein CO661_12075 [Sinorhizobium fredii]